MEYPILNKELSDKRKSVNEYVIEVSKDNYWIVVVNRTINEDKGNEHNDEYYHYGTDDVSMLEKVYRKQMELYFDYQKFEVELSKVDDTVKRYNEIYLEEKMGKEYMESQMNDEINGVKFQNNTEDGLVRQITHYVFKVGMIDNWDFTIKHRKESWLDGGEDETEIYDDNDNKRDVEWFVDRYFDSYESYEEFIDELSSRYQ
tara:strand:- start:2210 stop:2815 length:606 start_codon:yes stop_codon:yes gene_type:complete